MYAAVVRLRIDAAQAAAAAAAFSTDILPKITSAEGFRAGHWLEPMAGEGLGFMLFETEPQARRVVELTFGSAAPGVTILSADVRRVAVSVP